MQKTITGGDRTRCRDALRTLIYVGIGLSVFWCELALNLTLYLVLLSIILGFSWLSITIAISTCFIWFPLLLFFVPLALALIILMRVTRLRYILLSGMTKLGSEPMKSKIWTKFILNVCQK